MNELFSIYDYLINHKNNIKIFEDIQDRFENIFIIKINNLDIGYPTELLYKPNGKEYIKGNNDAHKILIDHHIAIITHVINKLTLITEDKNTNIITSNNIRYFINDFIWLKIHQLIGSKSFIDLLINYNIFDYIADSNHFLQLAGSKQINLDSDVETINYETLKRFIPSILMSNIKYISKKKHNKSIFENEELIVKNSKTWISLSELNKTKTDIIEQNHKNIKYIHIFNSIISNSNKAQESNSINAIVDKNLIYKFVKIIFNILIPTEFYNHSKNKVIFFNNIKKLLFADTNQYYDFKILMENIKNVKQTDKFTEILFFWLYFRLLPSLIKQFFYVTKLNTDYKLIFYRHDDALHFLEPVFKEYINEYFTKDAIKCDGDKSYHDKSNGYYHCHFRPVLKNLKLVNNFRFLTIPNHKLSLGGNREHYYFQQDNIIPVNKTLTHLRKNVFPVIFNDQFPTISSIDDVMEQFKIFKSKRSEKNKKLYYIKFDVKNSYDSVSKEYLNVILEKMFSTLKNQDFYLTNENYVVSSQRIHTKNKKISEFKVNKKIVVNNSNHKLKQNKKRKMNNNIKTIETNDFYVNNSVNILQEVPNIRKYTIEGIKYVINKELDSTIVNIGKHCYFRKKGIGQGLYFSGILCNLFYDDLVRNFKDILLDENEFFVRFMDDFLIITEDYTKINVIKDFILHNGFKQKYNVDINMDKLEFSKYFCNEVNRFSFIGLNFDLDEMSLTKDSSLLKIINYDHLPSYKEIFNKLIMIFNLRLSSKFIFSLELNSLSVIEKYINEIVENIAKMLLSFILKNKNLQTKDHFFRKFSNNLINMLAESINRQNQFKFFKDKNYYRFNKLCFQNESFVKNNFIKILLQKKNVKACSQFLNVLYSM